jgi:hypothetical protein
MLRVLKELMFVIMKTPEELREYAKRKLKRGYPEGELRNELLQEGYTAEQIQKAIYDPPTTPEEKKRAEQRLLDRNPFWYITSILIFLSGYWTYQGTGLPQNTSWGITMMIGGGLGFFVKLGMALYNSRND